MGDDPSTVAPARRRPHVGLVLAGLAPLGRPHAPPRSPRRCLVGCRQDRPRAAAARDDRGLARDVPRRPRDVRRAIYRAGLILLDLEDPRIVLRQTDEWLFGPSAPYEITGDVG